MNMNIWYELVVGMMGTWLSSREEVWFQRRRNEKWKKKMKEKMKIYANEIRNKITINTK